MKTENNIIIRAAGNGWICAEKPWGVSVHNHPGKDLVSLLASQLADDPDPLKTGREIRQGVLQPVHRLDRETSGLLLLARTQEALVRLSDKFVRGKVKKRYLALVHGSVGSNRKTALSWEMPLAKQAGGRTNPAGRGKKVRAVTRCRVLDESRHYTLLEIDLLTGRKHQIRRHAKLAGHPVTGDKRYGSKRSIKFLTERCGYHRMGLHAFRLEFTDKGDKIIITASQKIPESIKALFVKDN